jgi:hypothetical protein
MARKCRENENESIIHDVYISTVNSSSNFVRTLRKANYVLLVKYNKKMYVWAGIPVKRLFFSFSGFNQNWVLLTDLIGVLQIKFNVNQVRERCCGTHTVSRIIAFLFANQPEHDGRKSRKTERIKAP